MHEPSKIMVGAILAALLVAPGSAVAEVALLGAASDPHYAPPPFPAAPLTPAAFYHARVSGAETPCNPPVPRPSIRGLWRHWWTAWRSRRDPDPGQTVTTPFYLRSPLLSGFYDPADAGCHGAAVVRAAEPSEECAELMLSRGAERPVRFEVPLPQLGAASANRLGALINHRLEEGENVVVLLELGQKYPIEPSRTRGVAVSSCSSE